MLQLRGWLHIWILLRCICACFYWASYRFLFTELRWPEIPVFSSLPSCSRRHFKYALRTPTCTPPAACFRRSPPDGCAPVPQSPSKPTGRPCITAGRPRAPGTGLPKIALAAGPPVTAARPGPSSWNRWLWKRLPLRLLQYHQQRAWVAAARVSAGGTSFGANTPSPTPLAELQQMLSPQQTRRRW